MKLLAYIIVILFFLGLVGKVAEHEDAIKELRDTPTVTAKIDLTKKTVLQIALMEKEIDMLKLRVEELESGKAVEQPLIPLTEDDEQEEMDAVNDDSSEYVED